MISDSGLFAVPDLQELTCKGAKVAPAGRNKLSDIGNLPEASTVQMPPVMGIRPDRAMRSEEALRISATPPSVHNWAKSGILPRVMLPGHRRAIGFRESDVLALINGGGLS